MPASFNSPVTSSSNTAMYLNIISVRNCEDRLFKYISLKLKGSFKKSVHEIKMTVQVWRCFKSYLLKRNVFDSCSAHLLSLFTLYNMCKITLLFVADNEFFCNCRFKTTESRVL